MYGVWTRLILMREEVCEKDGFWVKGSSAIGYWRI